MESETFTLPKRIDDSMAVWEGFKEIAIKYKCISLIEGSPAMNPP